MPVEGYTKTPETQAHVGSEASMVEHIRLHPTPREYRRGGFVHDDDEGAAFWQDKARRLARWHREVAQADQ